MPASAVVRIFLLGRFEVVCDDRVLPASRWTRRKAATLLQRLALERRLLKDQAIEYLWAEADPGAGANNLYRTLHSLRQTVDASLGPGTSERMVRFDDGILSLHEDVWVDAEAFARRSATVTGAAPQRRVAIIAQALDLYQGELLPDERYADWAAAPREELRWRQRELRLALAAHARDGGDYPAAITELQTLLAQDPVDEPVHRELMAVYAAAGHRHEALRQYRACVDALADMLDAPPAPETDALHAQILHQPVAAPIALSQTPPTPAFGPAEDATPFIGRQEQLAALGGLIEEARRGVGRVAFVAGEAGVGKTRLVQEFVHDLPADVEVLVSHCFDEQPAPPYDPFVELLQRAPAPARSAAAELQRDGPDQSGGEDGRSERLLARRQLFQRIYGALRPTEGCTRLLVLEDLHWADEASHDLVHFLARAGAGDRLLILGTYRSEAIHPLHPLARLIARLSRERRYHAIGLPPLARPELATMLGAILDPPPPPALTQALHERTEGNPFFVEELLGALRNQGMLTDDVPDSERALNAVALPLSIKETILRRVAALDPTAAAVLYDAAVVGRHFDFDLLARLSGLDESELLWVLSELVERQLIVEERGSPEDRYRFRHELIRAALYEKLLRRERRLRHRQVLRALEALHAGSPTAAADQLAYHARLARDREATVRYSTLAGDRAAVLHAYREAVARYEDALEAGNQRGWPVEAERAALLARLARAAYLLDDDRRSADIWAEALAIYQRLGDRRNAADMQRWLGRVAYDRRDVAGAFRFARAALATLEGEPPCAELAMAQSALAQLHMLQLNVDPAATAECLAWGRRGLAMAEALGHDTVVCHALSSLGVALIEAGAWDESRACLERSLAIARAHDLPIDIMRGYINLSAHIIQHDGMRSALPLLQESWNYIMRHGILRGADVVFVVLGVSELEMGLWAEPEARITEVRQSELFDAPELQRSARWIGARIHWFRGRLDQARTDLEALRQELEPGTELHHLVAQDVAWVLLDLGLRDEALPIIDQINPDLCKVGGYVPVKLTYLADLYFQVGRRESAMALLKIVEQLGPRYKTEIVATMPLALRGLAALDADPATAAGYFARAIAACEQYGYIRNAVCARRRYAEALQCANAPQAEVRAALEAARSAAEAVGYTLELNKVEALLAAAPAGPGESARAASRAPEGATTHPHDGLTSRELEVLTLVTRGLSNRAIAETLMIAEKTAEVHVRNILGKLGLSSRTQAATYALEHGLVAPATGSLPDSP